MRSGRNGAVSPVFSFHPAAARKLFVFSERQGFPETVFHVSTSASPHKKKITFEYLEDVLPLWFFAVVILYVVAHHVLKVF